MLAMCVASVAAAPSDLAGVITARNPTLTNAEFIAKVGLGLYKLTPPGP
jgi:hypothetical protein